MPRDLLESERVLRGFFIDTTTKQSVVRALLHGNDDDMITKIQKSGTLHYVVEV